MLSIPGKIPLRIYPFFWVVALIIGWLNSYSTMPTVQTAFVGTILWVVVITVSIIVHEYGHALSALAFGQKAKINLIGFGGLTQRSGPKLKAWKEFIIVLNGPLFGFGLAFIAALMLNLMNEDSQGLWRYVLNIVFYVNKYWTLLNLLPVLPLDGGRLLSIFLEGTLGVRGIKIAFFLSILIAAVLGIFFFALQWVIAGSIFLILAFESYRSWQSSLGMHEQDQNEATQKIFKEAEEDLHAGRKQAALEKFRNVRRMTEAGVLYTMATNYEAILLKAQGDYKKAYEILHPLKNKLDLSAWEMLQQLAYYNRDWKEAIQLGNRIYSEKPHYEIAFINALSYAELGQEKPAVGWLESAIREGIPNIRVLLSKNEFDSIRSTESFQSLQKKINP